MKRVAFLSFAWDYQIVSEYYLGLQKFLQDKDDVQVFVFNVFGQNYTSHRPRNSYFEVFSLCDPSSFDGFLIQGNRTWPANLRQQFVDKVSLLGKPVVSINYDLTGAHSVGTNNYQAEYELVCRILQDRGCRRPAFVNGLKTSLEAQDRARGFYDACRALGVTDTRFYQANWQKEAGVVTAKKMLRRRDDLPDVVFCCNDDLAVGVRETLAAAGVRVPADVMVTGFDNRGIGREVPPRITTVDRDYRTIAATSLATLMRLMDGEELPEHVFSPARVVLSESCGYLRDESGDEQAVDPAENPYERFYHTLSDFQFAVAGADSMYALLENCEQLARGLDCQDAYLVLNDAYLNPTHPLDAQAFGPTAHLVARMERTAQAPSDDNHVYASFRTSSLLPPGAPTDHPIYMATPLLRHDACVGLVVTDGIPAITSSGFLAFFLTMLATSIDAVRMRERLDALEPARPR